MTNENKNIRIELLKIVFDKLLIGGLIVILGLWAQTLIEKYKAKEAFYAEISKVRVQKEWVQTYTVDNKAICITEV